jgi:hypothetical protein
MTQRARCVNLCRMGRTIRASAADGIVPIHVPIGLQRIAAAFEVPLIAVLDDAVLVRTWHKGAAELRDVLRRRHDWDASVAPYYMRWLADAANAA